MSGDSAYQHNLKKGARARLPDPSPGCLNSLGCNPTVAQLSCVRICEKLALHVRNAFTIHPFHFLTQKTRKLQMPQNKFEERQPFPFCYNCSCLGSTKGSRIRTVKGEREGGILPVLGVSDDSRQGGQSKQGSSICVPLLNKNGVSISLWSGGLTSQI